MVGINTPGDGWYLEYLLWLKPEEIRKELANCSVDELERLKEDAVKNEQYELAAVIRDVLKEKAEESKTGVATWNEDIRKQLVGAMAAEGADDATTEKSKNSITESLDDDNELVKADWEFINLWKRQQDVAKKIEDYYKERGIKNEFWHVISIHPRTIHFDGDSIFVDDMWNNHLFKQVNWEIKEIPLLKDKMYGNCKIRSIDKIWDYYAVNLCFLDADWWVTKNHKWEENSLYFIIDKDGNYLSGLREQTWKENFSLGRFWEYTFEQNLWKDEVICTIFNKNMEKIARYEDEKQGRNKKYTVYCDDKVCIIKEPRTSIYTVFSENQIVWKWTEKDLKWNEYMQDFWKMKEQENLQIKKSNEKRNRMRSTPFEERYMDKNHCKIVYKDDKKTAIAIENDKWETLFELSNIKKFSYHDENTLRYITDTSDRIEIQDWQSDSNILFIRVANSEGIIQKSIFINKTTWEKKEFEGYEWYYSFLRWKWAEVFINGSDDAKIFDDNLNYLWLRDNEEYNLWFITITKEENRDKKHYIVSKKTGKIVTRYLKRVWTSLPYYNYYQEGDKTYLIVSVPDKWVCQVEIP